MERSTLQKNAKATGVEVAKITVQSMYEFVRAIVTLVVGGLFMFYTFASGVGVMRSVQSGLFGEAVILAGMFLLASGATVLYVGLINGVVSEPIP